VKGELTLKVAIPYTGSFDIAWIPIIIVGIILFVYLLSKMLVKFEDESGTEDADAIRYHDVEVSTELEAESETDQEEAAELHEHTVPKPYSNSCPYCGVNLTRADASFCWNCGASLGQASEPAVVGGGKKKPVRTIGKCMVCNLKVETDDAALWCPFCGNVTHKTHMLEWLHVKDYCPSCHRHLEESDLKDQPTRRRPRKHGSSKRQS